MTLSDHIHHSTYYWYDSNDDENSPPPERVVKIACGMAHDSGTSMRSYGNHGTVGWNSNDRQSSLSPADNHHGLG